MIYQERNLAPDLSVEANIMLGLEPTNRLGFLKKDHIRQQVGQALAALNHTDIPLDIPVRRLGAGQQQLVEIAKALVTDARLIVFDEPTSSLARADVEHLFVALRRLRDRGLCILYISHYLEDVMSIADRYTVLRDGRRVGDGQVAAATLDGWVRLMVGREVRDLYPRSPHTAGEVVLELEDVWTHAGGPTQLALRRGEVLGIAGLVGAGRTELLRAVFGLDVVRRGELRVGVYQGPASPAARLQQGVGMLSEDRQAEGLLGGMSIRDNIILSKLGALVWPRRARQHAQHWTAKLEVVCRDVDQTARELSGGNQQKVALARLLHHDVDVLLLDEPTRGIDVASRAQIYRIIDDLAVRGRAVLMVSSYLPELFGVCDRIAVMRRGRLGEARPTAELDAHSVLREAAVAS
jgi:ribose transport system ATP-binding protein